MSNYEEMRIFLLEYRQRVRGLRRNNRNYVFNEDINSYINENITPQLIIVGDNPGYNEHRYKKFLHENGNAGKIARNFLKSAYGDDCFSREIIVFNKSNFYTSISSDLNSAILRNNREIKEDISFNAGIVVEISRILNIPVLIIGLNKNIKLFESFHDDMESAVLEKEILIHKIPHFSRSSCFQKGWMRRYGDVYDNFIDGRRDMPRLIKDNGGINYKILCQNDGMAMEYLRDVMLSEQTLYSR
ncbi:hypothetical protein ACRC7T_14930 [Segnochrobactraceae bacterium EtOH-i3]